MDESERRALVIYVTMFSLELLFFLIVIVYLLMTTYYQKVPRLAVTEAFAPTKSYSDDGTAALPAYTFSGDTNTGLYRSAADTLSVAAGGTRVKSMSSTGELSLVPIVSSSVILGLTTIYGMPDSAVELTAAQMVNALVHGTPTSGRAVTTATAAEIVTYIPNCQVGSSFTFALRNTAASAVSLTLGADTGITFATGNTATATQGQTRIWLGVVTNATSGTEAVTLYSMGASAH